jgi:hypothetical protein
MRGFRLRQVKTGALIKRINRKLLKDDQMLRATCGDRWRNDLGDFYIVDLYRNNLVAQHVDIEALSRELGVLTDSDEMVD